MLLQKDIDPGSMTHQRTSLQMSMNPDKNYSFRAMRNPTCAETYAYVKQFFWILNVH